MPIMLAYVYGVVPISLCRGGGCGVSRGKGRGVRIDFDEDDGPITGEDAKRLPITYSHIRYTDYFVTIFLLYRLILAFSLTVINLNLQKEPKEIHMANGEDSADDSSFPRVFLQWQTRGEPSSPRASVRAVWTERSAV